MTPDISNPKSALDEARPRVVCVPDLVAAQAAATPLALAVGSGDVRVTYCELEARAERLANRLRALAIGPGDAVGLYVNSSPAMVVGALGILKAGAAYLPLDPALPAERLDFLVNDARPPALVAARCLADRLPRGSVPVIGLDAQGLDADAEPPPRPPAALSADTLAYVIYTSGSTGRPKGVEITHRSLVNLVRWHCRAFAVTPRDRATQIASVGFDAAVWELWPYLATGASVFIPDAAVRQDTEALQHWLVAEQITITFLATPLAERMVRLPWPGATALRLLLTGADTLHRRPPAGLPFVLVNNYGPTECTVVATSGPVEPEGSSDTKPSIGRPIDGVKVHLFDEDLCPVEEGRPGEICIGGAGVGVGYVNAPGLTAQKFIKDPSSTEPGARLYRTGDLARRLPDGQLAFLGRIDEQIKIRGYRIEPAEIVTALATHPSVRESAVIACEFTPEDKRLVAYVVATPGSRPTSRSLRDFLGKRLPDYMIPSAFVGLPALPLAASGKVDRAALPFPDEAFTLPEEDFEPPHTPIEERVAATLAPLLGIRRVSVADNFFMLGGHSMLGTQLIGRLREIFSVELALRTLFETPTVAGLSAEIERLLLEKVQGMQEEEAERMLQ